MNTDSIRFRLPLWLGTLGMLAFTSWAQAAPAVRCTFTVTPFSTYYGSLLNVTAGGFTVDCTKTGSATYYVSATGTNTPVYRAVLGGNAIVYGLFQDSGCSIPWNNTTGLISKAVASPSTNNHTYSLCIPAGQTVPAGTYSDTIRVAFDASSTANPQGVASFTDFANIQVNIIVPGTCTLTTGFPDITFPTYTSFSAINVLANTSFTTNCNSGLPYTIEVAPPGGTITGVDYTLRLGTSPDTGGSNPLTGITGTGGVQTFYVNGEIAAGQSGTCAAQPCGGTNPHTLTITY